MNNMPKTEKNMLPWKEGIFSKAQEIGSKIRSFFSALIEKVPFAISIICWISVIVLCFITASICLSYIQLSTQNITFLSTFKFLNMCSQMLNFNGDLPAGGITKEFILENSDTVKSMLEFAVNLFVAIIGITLSVGTFGSYLMKLRAVRRRASFQKKEIHETGVDDIKIMLKYYKGADMVKIYSGTFGWVGKNDEMKETLVALAEAKKLSLYAPDIELAKKNLCQLDVLLTHIHPTTVNLRFSYIERDNAKYLLYRQEEQKEEQKHTYVITVSENIESQYLLQAISKLME